MSFVNFAPSWFFGYDILIELVFFVVALIISIFAFKVYKKTYQKSVLLFSIGFFFISFSYIIQSLFNFLAFSKLNENVCSFIKIHSVAYFNFMGIIAHIIFMILGLSILTYMTLKINRDRAFLLLILLPTIGLLFSSNIILMFFLYSTLFLSFIAYHFIKNHFKKKNNKSLLTALAFTILFVGNLKFIFLSNDPVFYALGHIVNLVAYILIIWNFYLVLKR